MNQNLHPIWWPFVPWLLISLTDISLLAQNTREERPDSFRILTFNILQGGGDASNVGFDNATYDGTRLDEIGEVIKFSQADIVGIQEDLNSDKLLAQLGDDWFRYGTIYAKCKLSAVSKGSWLTVCHAHVGNGLVVAIVNCHWAPSPYGPYELQKMIDDDSLPRTAEAIEMVVLELADKSGSGRGYQPTLDAINVQLGANYPVVVTGDFNEPSHLDWTAAASQRGMDRWVKNDSGTPLRFHIAWKGSKRLTDLGLRDAYRAAHPNEVEHPGITWTPVYAENAPGRRPYSRQVLDRIDMIYFQADRLEATAADVIGEAGSPAELIFARKWPSDHRAVVAEIRFLD